MFLTLMEIVFIFINYKNSVIKKKNSLRFFFQIALQGLLILFLYFESTGLYVWTNK